jgi:hypothetical protein
MSGRNVTPKVSDQRCRYPFIPLVIALRPARNRGQIKTTSFLIPRFRYQRNTKSKSANVSSRSR